MSFKKKLAAVFVVITIAGAASAAYAYWTGGGSGSGSASAAAATQAVTVNQTSSITGLYPGATPVALSGTFTNPNAGPVYVANVTATVATFSSQTDTNKPACTQADFAIGGTATVNAEVDDGSTWSGLTVALLNGSGNQDNCKNASITITYTANAA